MVVINYIIFLFGCFLSNSLIDFVFLSHPCMGDYLQMTLNYNARGPQPGGIILCTDVGITRQQNDVLDFYTIPVLGGKTQHWKCKSQFIYKLMISSGENSQNFLRKFQLTMVNQFLPESINFRKEIFFLGGISIQLRVYFSIVPPIKALTPHEISQQS